MDLFILLNAHLHFTMRRQNNEKVDNEMVKIPMFSASSCFSMSTALKWHCKDKEFVHYARTERRPI